MNEISKVSDITANDLAEYIRLPEVIADDLNLLNTYLTVSKDFIANYTGVGSDNLDDYPDFVQVVFVLCQDMYDNRSLYVDKTNLNMMVEAILGLHRVNFL